MPGVLINRKEILVPNLLVLNPYDNPDYFLNEEDYRIRPNTWIRGIVLHTTKGIPGGKDKRPQIIHPGIGPNTRKDERMSKMWSLDERKAGAHLICDHDGSWVCTCDLQRHASFHAGNVNNVTIGIEIYQGKEAELYEDQLISVIKMLDFLTRTFSIQRQFHQPYKKRALQRGLNHGLDMVGIYGHRDCSNNRGLGDPGDAIFDLLAQVGGYRRFDFAKSMDKKFWKKIQKQYGLLEDGIPGPKTISILRSFGYAHGIITHRPGD